MFEFAFSLRFSSDHDHTSIILVHFTKFSAHDIHYQRQFFFLRISIGALLDETRCVPRPYPWSSDLLPLPQWKRSLCPATEDIEVPIGLCAPPHDRPRLASSLPVPPQAPHPRPPPHGRRSPRPLTR